jgi:hypothetical protein
MRRNEKYSNLLKNFSGKLKKLQDSDKKVLEIKEKQVAFSSSDEEYIYLHQYSQYNTK